MKEDKIIQLLYKTITSDMLNSTKMKKILF